MNTTYSFPPYMNIDEGGNATPIESPRDRLIREMSVAFCTGFDAHKLPRESFDVGLSLIRDHADSLYPPE